MPSGQESSGAHWDQVYSRTPSIGLSWYQSQAQPSTDLIRNTGVRCTAPIIDVGGGASVLVDALIALHYSSLTILDISAAALTISRERLGPRATLVRWLVADVTQAFLQLGPYDLWHDRAVFHFLTQASARRRYIETLQRSVNPGGYLIIATFDQDGPTQCSGLPVVRYSAQELQHELGPQAFALISTQKEQHQTPRGIEQAFRYCLFQKL